MPCVSWSSLPADLIEDISGRLSSDGDHLHIHQVCTHWRASTSSPAAFRPWVLTCGTYSNGLPRISDCSLRLPRLPAPKLVGGAPPASLPPYCCGASFGWLAMVDDERSPTRHVLWDPLTNAAVPLPCLSPLSRVFISGDPLTSSSWVAIATQLKPDGEAALVWRPGEDDWTVAYERGRRRIVAVTFHGGKAYCMDHLKDIIICDLDTAATHLPKCTRVFNVVHVANELCTCDRFHPVGSLHLVPCNGDLLLVVLRSRGSGHPSWAEVYRPEWTCETGPFSRVELRERVDLGDYSLFLSARGHTFALSAKEFPAIKRNCVYYAGRLDYNSCISYWITVFSLDSGGVLKEIPYLNKLKQGEARWTPCAWFCPRTLFLNQQRRP